MWNSTSDNKKSEDLEDCSCSSRSSGGSESSNNTGAGSSGSAIATVVVSATQTTQQQQQTKLNTFDNTTAAPTTTTTTTTSENNRNISAKNFGAQEFKNDFSKLEEGTASETIDSGFISGPQRDFCASEDEEDNAIGRQQDQYEKQQQQQYSTKTVNKQLNIAVHAAEEDTNVPDSGIIDEEFDDDDKAEYEAEQQQHKNKEQEHDQQAADAGIAKSTFSHLAESNSAVATVAAAATAKAENQMILKQNVDAGMSEWFCNLSLQNTPTTQQQQQQQQQKKPQQTIAGMNNLSGSGQRIAINACSNTTSSQQSRQQQPKAAGNSATTTTITPSNAWEQFYQQNDEGDTPLHLACISGYEDVVAALIRMAPHPCLFNIQNDEAQTSLHLAVLTAQPKIVRMLLIAGAEPTIRDRHGNTALHLACISGEQQCVNALTIQISASEVHEAHRKYGHRSNDKTVSYLKYARLPSDLEIRNYDGERCVHLAAQAGHINVLSSLVECGADINAREGKSGRTPLHIAIECCNEDLANFLLDQCPSLNLETATYAGLTAYQVACILNKSQMQNMLEKRGAEPLTPPDSDYDSDIDSDLEDSKMYDRFGDPGYFISSYNGGNFMKVA